MSKRRYNRRYSRKAKRPKAPNYNKMPLERLKTSLVEIINSNQSHTSKVEAIKRIGRAITANLERLKSEGVPREKIVGLIEEQLAVLNTLKSSHLSSNVDFSLVLFEQKLKRVLPRTRIRAFSMPSAKKNFMDRVSRLAGKKSSQRDIESALDKLIGIAFREAVIAFLDGQPSKAFTKPLDETLFFLEMLGKKNPTVNEEPWRKVLAKRKSFLKQMTNPENVRFYLEKRKDRRLKISEQIKRAKTIKEINELAQTIRQLHSKKALDKLTNNALLLELSKKKEALSKKIIGNRKEPKKEEFEINKGSVWLGSWVPLYRLERYLKRIPPSRHTGALADFHPRLKKAPLGKKAVDALREAQNIHIREYGKPASVITLLHEMEQRGRKL